MKKTLRGLLLAVIMIVMLFSLTACGGNKLVATKTFEEDGMKYEQKMEISFKKDKVDKVKMTSEFDKEESAGMFYGFFSLAKSMDTEGELSGLEIKQDGKKVIIEMDSKSFQAMNSEDDYIGNTKEEIKKSLEADGYKVK